MLSKEMMKLIAISRVLILAHVKCL